MVLVPPKNLKKIREWDQEAIAWKAEEGQGLSLSTLAREGALDRKVEADLDHHPGVAHLARLPVEATGLEAAAEMAEGLLHHKVMLNLPRCMLLAFLAVLNKRILRRFSTTAVASEAL